MTDLDHAVNTTRWFTRDVMMTKPQFMHDMYVRGLFWILRDRHGAAGGWPPRDINKVCGWTSVRMLAHLTDRPVKQVAGELIDWSYRMHHGEKMP